MCLYCPTQLYIYLEGHLAEWGRIGHNSITYTLQSSLHIASQVHLYAVFIYIFFFFFYIYHCALFPPVQVFTLLCVLIALCFPCLVCLLCVCNVFRCSGCCVLCSHRVSCVGVVIPRRVLVVCCMLLCSVQGVVFVIVCVHVQRVKSGAFSHCKKYT